MQIRAILGCLSVIGGFLCTSLALPTASAQETPGITVTRADGGPMQTKISNDHILNKKSSLRREWIAIHQANLPIDFVKTPGISIDYSHYPPDDPHPYRYTTRYGLIAKEHIVAVEVRFIVFDLWWNQTMTLSSTCVEDIPTGTTEAESAWVIRTESAAASHYASIAYIARVRTASGKIITADLAPVLAAARKYSDKLREADLE